MLNQFTEKKLPGQSDNVLAKYVYGPEIDEPVRMTRNGTNYYYHAVALGTVSEVTDGSGNVIERYSYDVYGTPQIHDAGGSSIANSQIGNRLLFQGRDRDADTGWYNFRIRYYSPTLGRFAQTDPILQSGGPNFYSFVFNNPVNWTDPYGYKCENEMAAWLSAQLQTGLAQIALTSSRTALVQANATAAVAYGFFAAATLAATTVCGRCVFWPTPHCAAVCAVALVGVAAAAANLAWANAVVNRAIAAVAAAQASLSAARSAEAAAKAAFDACMNDPNDPHDPCYTDPT